MEQYIGKRILWCFNNSGVVNDGQVKYLSPSKKAMWITDRCISMSGAWVFCDKVTVIDVLEGLSWGA